MPVTTFMPRSFMHLLLQWSQVLPFLKQPMLELSHCSADCLVSWGQGSLHT